MRTFLDSGVLLTGWKGKNREEAIAVMEDETREFVSSQLVRLELNPKAAFHKQSVELEFYREHFGRVRKEEPLSEALGEEAFKLSVRCNDYATQRATTTTTDFDVNGGHTNPSADDRESHQPMYDLRFPEAISIHPHRSRETTEGRAEKDDRILSRRAPQTRRLGWYI